MFTIPEIIINILSFLTDYKDLKNAVSYFVIRLPSLKFIKTTIGNNLKQRDIYNAEDCKIHSFHASCSGIETKPILDLSGNLKKLDVTSGRQNVTIKDFLNILDFQESHKENICWKYESIYTLTVPNKFSKVNEHVSVFTNDLGYAEFIEYHVPAYITHSKSIYI